LTHLDDPGGWFDRAGIKRPEFSSASRARLIELAFPEFADRKDLIDRYANMLTSNRLVSDTISGQMSGGGLWVPATTDLGREFLSFIKDPRPIT